MRLRWSEYGCSSAWLPIKVRIASIKCGPQAGCFRIDRQVSTLAHYMRRLLGSAKLRPVSSTVRTTRNDIEPALPVGQGGRESSQILHCFVRAPDQQTQRRRQRQPKGVKTRNRR
jgi:hypothetical protein